jgi:hypothetical protein
MLGEPATGVSTAASLVQNIQAIAQDKRGYSYPDEDRIMTISPTDNRQMGGQRHKDN